MLKKLYLKLILVLLLVTGITSTREVKTYAEDEIGENGYIIEINLGLTKNLEREDRGVSSYLKMPKITINTTNKETNTAETYYTPTYKYNAKEDWLAYDTSSNRYSNFGYSLDAGPSTMRDDSLVYIPSATKISSYSTYISYLCDENGNKIKNKGKFAVESILFDMPNNSNMQIYSIRILAVYRNNINGYVPVSRVGYISDYYMLDQTADKAMVVLGELKYYYDSNGKYDVPVSENNRDDRSILIDRTQNKLIMYDILEKRADSGETIFAKWESDYPGVTEDYTRHTKTQLAVELTVADEYMAGIEAYRQHYGKNFELKNIPESLIFETYYLDTQGAVHKIEVPVVTSAIAYFIDNAGNGNIVDLLYQGSKLVFQLELIDFKCFVDNITLKFINSSNDKEYLRFLINFKNPDLYKDYFNFAMLSKDAVLDFTPKLSKEEKIIIDRVRIYELKNSLICKYKNNNLMEWEGYGDSDEICYAAVPDGNAFTLTAEKSTDTKKATVKLTQGKYSDEYKYKAEKSGQYLCSIDTSELEGAGTECDITISFIYENDLGVEKTIKDIRLKDIIRDYYGYSKDKSIDTIYKEQLKDNGTISFFLKVDDLSYFSSVTIKLSDSKTDREWIMKSFTISLVDYAEPLNLFDLNGKYVFSRKVNTMGNIAELYANDTVEITEDSSAGFYFKSGQEKKINFISEMVEHIGDDSMYDAYVDLTYKKASSGIDFNSKAYTYKVTVSIPNSKSGTADEDDAGSLNYFYFKLVFVNGESAYVQANQQIEGDGFRAGGDAVFYIYVNHNYGDLKEVRIIPENSEEIGKPYDKLKISTITVDMSDAYGNAKTWRITGGGTGVGWVGIDYSDNKAASHSESQITKVCKVESAENSLNLIFNISTEETKVLKDGQMQTVDSLEDGWLSVKALINYVSAKTGKEESEEINLIEEMRYFNGDNFTRGSGVKSTERQFAKGHTDRFMIQMHDIASITSITLSGNSKAKTSIFIGDISVYILNKGSLMEDRTLNYENEFIIANCKKTLVATLDESGMNNEWVLNSSGLNQKTFMFNSEANIMIGEGSMYTVTKEPESGNDMINVIAYTADGRVYDGRLLNALIQYKDYSGQSNTVWTRLMCNKQPVFSNSNIQTPNLAVINNIVLKSDDDIPIKEVIIQRMRSGVAVASYRLEFATESNNARNMIRSTSVERITQGTYCQKIYIELGSETKATELIQNIHDIAVSLNCKPSSLSTYDKAIKTINYFYNDDEISKSIKPGDVIEFTTYEYGVEKLNSITLSATGKVKLDIKRIAIGVYSGDSLLGWFSFYNSDGVIVENTSFEFGLVQYDNTASNIDDNTVNLIDFTFDTMESHENTGFVGVDSAIAMEIDYKDNDGSIKKHFVSDLKDHLVEGDFQEGHTAKIRLLVNGISSTNITAVKLCPYDKKDNPAISNYIDAIYSSLDTNITWGLKRMIVEFGDGENRNGDKPNRISINPEKLITTTRGEEISLINSIVQADIEYLDLATEKIEKKKAYSNEETVIEIPYSDSSVYVNMNIDIFNSNEKKWRLENEDITAYGNLYCDYTFDEETGEASGSQMIMFTLEGDAVNTVEKKITITPSDNPDNKLVVILKLLSYEDTYGVKPLKITASTNDGKTRTAYTNQNVDWSGISEDVSQITFVCDSLGEIIEPIITVNKVGGSNVSYTYVTSKDRLTVYFGNRGDSPTSFEVKFEYNLNGEAYEIDWFLQLESSDDHSIRSELGYVGYSYDSAHDYKIQGYVYLGRDDSFYLPYKDNLKFTFVKIYEDRELIDVTEYEDETEIVTKEIIETISESTEESATSLETETTPENTETEDESAETTQETTEEVIETESRQPETTIIIESETIIIPDDASAIIQENKDGGFITLPKASKNYKFRIGDDTGEIGVIRLKLD